MIISFTFYLNMCIMVKKNEENKMSIVEMKMKAEQLYRKNKEQLVPHFFFVGYISLLAQYLQSGFFSFFVSLFLCSIAHGYVICSMKVVNEEKPLLSLDDSLIGITHFTRVFPVYFIRKLLIVFLLALSVLPTLLNFTFNQSLFSWDWIVSTGNTLIHTELFIPNLQLILPLFQNAPLTVNIILSIFLYLLLIILSSFMPYIIEEDDYSWIEALARSCKMVKGQLKPLLFMYFLYLPRYLCYWIVSGFIATILGNINEVLMLLCLVVSLFMYIELVKGRFEIAKYLLYKELTKEQDDERYEEY